MDQTARTLLDWARNNQKPILVIGGLEPKEVAKFLKSGFKAYDQKLSKKEKEKIVKNLGADRPAPEVVILSAEMAAKDSWFVDSFTIKAEVEIPNRPWCYPYCRHGAYGYLEFDFCDTDDETCNMEQEPCDLCDQGSLFTCIYDEFKEITERRHLNVVCYQDCKERCVVNEQRKPEHKDLQKCEEGKTFYEKLGYEFEDIENKKPPTFRGKVIR